MGYDDKFDAQMRATNARLQQAERQIVEMVDDYDRIIHSHQQSERVWRMAYFLIGALAGGAAVWFVLSR
jgi:hypothetical protein